MFRQIIKKLNNFRFTAIIASIISGIAGLYALGSFICYNFAGPESSNKKYRSVGFTHAKASEYTRYTEAAGKYLGMAVFFTALVVVVISVVIIYKLLPAIMNKDKVTPNKYLLLTGAIGTVFELGLFVLMIYLLGDDPVSKVGILVSLPFGVLSMIGTGLYLVPFLNCDFYMPEIKK